MIEIPTVESSSHVVDDEMIGLDDGVEAGGDDDAGAEVLSGQMPVEPQQSGHEHWTQILDDDDCYFVSSYKRIDQSKSPGTHQVGASYAYMVQGDVPNTYKDTMSCSNSNAWLDACQDELLSLQETWNYVPVHVEEVEADNVVGCQWVFALKRGPDGSLE